MNEKFDLVVIGGGINGAAVARDAAGRGLKVFLAEARDYAGATSSASSKLIHGGLRYLEHYEFRLVRESLREREVLLRLAPHLVSPLQFLVPLRKDARRPVWMMRLGLFLYDRLSSRQVLAATGALDPVSARAVPRLRQEGLKAVLHYPDCWTDDARLTLETLLDARGRGADIGNYREVTAITPLRDGFSVTVADGAHAPRVIEAPYVVNAAGPWVNRVYAMVEGGPAPRRAVRLVRGSHIVVPMPQPPDLRAFTLQNDDGRVVFTIPWAGRYLILGTTDVVHEGDPRTPECTDAERDYLLACYARYFAPPLEAADVIWSWAGVRPLIDDGSDTPSKVTREYVLDTVRRGNGAFLTIYGGKITTHRVLGQRVMRELGRLGAPVGLDWTASEPLHGGALTPAELEQLAQSGPEEISLAVCRRWTSTYGSEAAQLFAAVRHDPDLAREVVPGVPEAELVHAVAVEDVKRPEDFLYRRTKLFIALDETQVRAVADWFAERAAADDRAAPDPELPVNVPSAGGI